MKLKHLLAPNLHLPPCRGKAGMGVELWNGNISTPTLPLPLQGGGNGVAHQIKGAFMFYLSLYLYALVVESFQ